MSYLLTQKQMVKGSPQGNYLEMWLPKIGQIVDKTRTAGKMTVGVQTPIWTRGPLCCRYLAGAGPWSASVQAPMLFNGLLLECGRPYFT